MSTSGPTPTPATPATEEYLELLYRLDAARQGVRPVVVARQLGISTAAVAEMLARLEHDHLIARDADRTIRLTPAGLKLGRAQLRKHRLLERLLHGVLGRPWDVVHDEACRIEHAVSDELAESLDLALGQPTTCPHGNPIPDGEPDGAGVPADAAEALARRPAGSTVVVVRIAEEQSDLLRYLLSLGLLPGAELQVEQVAPLGGPLLIRVGEARYAIGRDVASRIWVRARPEPRPEEALAPDRELARPARA